MNSIGLYLHIPFCRSKCPYCDFYSLAGGVEEKQLYTTALKNRIISAASLLQRKADTLYIGGGTPSLLGAEKLAELVNTARKVFLTNDAEITVECNPHGLDGDFFAELFSAGVNRISLGMQSAIDSERRALGRLSHRSQVEKCVLWAQSSGFKNISLDIMLGIPNQSEKSLGETLDFCLSLDIPHISAYILKLEENTFFHKNREKLHLPDDDLTADLYIQMCQTLTDGGIKQYEISNLARRGFESRHNLKYWHCEEYLGLGPSAHSFIDGRRFYFERDLKGFIDGARLVCDGEGGDFTEYAMLALRLCEGLREKQVIRRFGHGIPNGLQEKAKSFIKHGLMVKDAESLRLTREGFLLSNTILAEIL